MLALVRELLDRVRHGDDDAWVELRGLGDELVHALPVFRDWLVDDTDEALQLRAAELLEGLRQLAAPAVPELGKALRLGAAPLRAAAADTLAAIGGPALQELSGCLLHPDPEVRRAVCRALGATGPAAAGTVPILLERVRDRSEAEEVRLRAIWAIGRIGTDQAVEGLAEVFEAEGGTLALWIAEALGTIGRAARPVATTLRDALARDDAEVALASAGALLEIRMYEDQVIWSLIRWLQHSKSENWDVDIAAESALLLGEMGGSATSAIPALLHAAANEDEFLRRNAKLAIAKIRPEYSRV
jgi:HEAT repeat protein